MSASSELLRERIEELTSLIAQAKERNDTTANQLEEERRSLLKKLTEMNERVGQVLTDSASPRSNVMKG